jgi:hypothetical protein
MTKSINKLVSLVDENRTEIRKKKAEGRISTRRNGQLEATEGRLQQGGAEMETIDCSMVVKNCTDSE